MLHDLLHPVEASNRDRADFTSNPLGYIGKSAATAAGLPLIQGVYEGAKRSIGELKQAADAAKEGNGAGVVSHGIGAIPILGSGMTTAAMQAPKSTGSYVKDIKNVAIDPSTMGTLTGTAMQLAPLVPEAAADAITAVPKKMGGMIQDAAVGDRDAAALRGLKVPNGKKVLPMQDAVELARPYLQGASSLEDLQGKIKPAKAEIWAPYKETLNAVGESPIADPNGNPTTLNALEQERKELSAMNRGLKTGDPAALQLAQQKGLSQADALAREEAIKSTLDPALQQYGINPAEIRKNFSAVSRVGNQVAGRSTILDKDTPYGFGKMTKFDITKPLQEIGNIGSGLRDLVAGRPLMGGSATDVGIREGFAKAGEKPNLGKFKPLESPEPAGLLGDGAIADPGGADYTKGGFPSRSSVVTPAPMSPKLLGSIASPDALSDGLPVGNLHPGRVGGNASLRVEPTQFADRFAPTSSGRTLIANPDGTVRPEPFALPAPPSAAMLESLTGRGAPSMRSLLLNAFHTEAEKAAAAHEESLKAQRLKLFGGN
jgi:hypothetical protein